MAYPLSCGRLLATFFFSAAAAAELAALAIEPAAATFDGSSAEKHTDAHRGNDERNDDEA